jgi:23S rRNA (cytidine1920-2'-O)/16S rRNA (cytidine1409-2'-O)-methyltransferase
MAKQSERTRLDVLLVERGLIESRELARRQIMAGEVEVNGQLETKPGTRVGTDSEITLKAKPRFVSRGGEKLAAALSRFEINPAGLICVDVGASTGGFTDCLLQAGAKRVYAIDVGYGQMAWQLRQDERVIVMERVNARYLETLPEPVQFASVDVSFISLQYILPPLRRWLSDSSEVVALVKPQFEAGRGEVGKGGVVREAETHRAVLTAVADFAQREAFSVQGIMPSPLHGPAGNIEFLMWLSKRDEVTSQPIGEWISEAVHEAHTQPPTNP